jgi:hypothetical protein
MVRHSKPALHGPCINLQIHLAIREKQIPEADSLGSTENEGKVPFTDVSLPLSELSAVFPHVMFTSS